MEKFARLTLRFILAWLTTFTFASIAHSQMVLSGLEQQGIVIPPFERLQMTLSDWWGLLPGYGAVIAVGMLIALCFGGWVCKKTGTPGGLLYPVAGALAMLSIVMAMQPIMDITLIAGARSNTGLALQALSGLIGGWAFYALRKKPKLHFD
ncbi:hypothetical protein [Lacimicrobium alkaliphilum]|uniref:Uncharacterized protein n=1 Tax=Lacimicrobium alkaliphilum TaxID=1526571 RepID=A0ABQ1RF49_9ALTE|nr:hypothetical protein [Lacimicrobium alkaliphilum]GGD65948.1 hypothetical protein GCM10011357_21470 [Lacimicrobium alkaliphilum]